MDNNELQIIDRESRDYKVGRLCVLGCQLLWGFLPIYWHMLRPINSWIIILYRIVLVFAYAYLVAGFKYGFRHLLKPLRDKKTRRTYMLASLFITANWSTYIWAVNADYVIQTTIGYYIEPLMICAIGIIVFKEKLNIYNSIAMGLACISVGIILIHFGQLPWIGLALALTFSVYSAIKKTVKQPAVVSMVFETIWFAPIALIAIIYLETHGMGALAEGSTSKYLLLYLCGIVTLLPMSLFAHAATRVSLFFIGICQYISPTISLICAVKMFGEDMDQVQLICFAIIWLGLSIFSYGEIKNKTD